MSTVLAKARALAGVVAKDLWRFERALAAADNSYLALCNRNEHLQPAPIGEGFRCEWKWTSDLHAPKHVPWLGKKLMERALADAPIILKSRDQVHPNPRVTFIIGHRGKERLAQLQTTLESISGQDRDDIECIVVEQDVLPLIASDLPAWVRYLHVPPPVAHMPYCRSWTFNLAAQHAKGDVLVLHDNDLLVPTNYASIVLDRVARGYEVVNVKRFIFYLSQCQSLEVQAAPKGQLRMASNPTSILQNAEGGGSIAITAAAFAEIGGMDESFVGWGGEDNEFWERAQTRRVWTWGMLPLVHLWHASQPGKSQNGSPTHTLYQQLSNVPPETRIAALGVKKQGLAERPAGYNHD
ncbi:glycosyltransferase family 2 protein [Caenimonas koreensis]|uniref:glycosyltransferase family 2 protein n=1 Tax=Caenimonas koreensis TaxID=367474 RepID=UPI003784421C